VVTPANQDERTQVGVLARRVQAAPGHSVKVAFVDYGHTGNEAPAAATLHDLRLEVVTVEQANKLGFILLPKRWISERGFAWNARLRRPARDYETVFWKRAR